MTGRLRSLVWIALGALVGGLLFGWRPVAHALPEYATRTGEPCATCHVNPAGGGARTVRGTLWLAAGKPDTVPPLPGGASSAGAAAGKPGSGGAVTDGASLFASFGCAGCHGAAGQGGAGPALNGGERPADQVSQIIRAGKGTMLAFKQSSLSDADLAAIVLYVGAIGRGEVKAPAGGPAPILAPAHAVCGTGPFVAAARCGGN